MSDLYRSAIHARASKLPPVPPTVYPGHTYGDEVEDEEAEMEDSVGSLPSEMGPPKSFNLGKRQKKTPNPSFAPISAAAYFEQATQVSVVASGLDFRAYYTPPKFSDGTVLVCHHGAGYSGLSFACLAKEFTRLSKGECGVLSLDCRGHGKTTRIGPTETSEEDLSIDTLTSDLVNLLSTIFSDFATAPTFLLVGHSLGGSVCVRACPLLQDRKYKVTGVVVLDVVEEFTLEALPMMHSLLDARPEGFDSAEDAVEWHVKTNVIRNVDSARVSIPAIVVPNPKPNTRAPDFLWRTPLRSTAPYWTSWFTGLSSKFLSARTARLLVLAGTERLDKELMIGQMQGKFQLEVLAGVGHMIHEDDPARLAELLVEFWRRNERVLVGIKKVGDL
ncbi:Protein with carboxyl methyl esterase activity [Steccherinum ochraceum]|uniref:Protein phosphatase methylesterase 1 n=1 Tax=Steccherinum ochraceum TaxID=92696 RepID=A0A4R0RAG1_9APHY|nr:Protein with carboxyl methyl esterase activity [Steccherinum ochraceum]